MPRDRPGSQPSPDQCPPSPGRHRGYCYAHPVRQAIRVQTPNSEVVLLEEASHLLVLEQPDEANDAIEDWPDAEVDAARAASAHLPRQRR